MDKTSNCKNNSFGERNSTFNRGREENFTEFRGERNSNSDRDGEKNSTNPRGEGNSNFCRDGEENSTNSRGEKKSVFNPGGERKILLMTGGGTAGHIMPNLALLPYLGAFDGIVYVGSVGGMEERLVREKAPWVEFRAIPAVKLVRSFTLKNLGIPAALLKSVRAARKIIDEFGPKVIFSKGGYVGLPVCLAAGRTPTVLHESDSSLGLANRLTARRCDRLLTSFDLGRRDKRTVVTGSPLRRELYLGNRERAREICGFFGSAKPVLLVTGGSLGAQALNAAIEENLAALTARFDVIHVAGKGNERGPQMRGYFRTGFTDNMPDFMRLADLALTRGGANTLFELAALAVPALVVPLPKGASRGDQIVNAEYFRTLGTAKVLLQSDLADLVPALDEVFRARESMKAAARRASGIDGTAKIAEILSSYAK